MFDDGFQSKFAQEGWKTLIQNRDIGIMAALRKPDRTQPGAFDLNVRAFDGEILPIVQDEPPALYVAFADEMVDELRTSPLEAAKTKP